LYSIARNVHRNGCGIDMDLLTTVPVEVWYLTFLIFFIAILFVGLKRPVYECMIAGYVLVILMTGRYDLFLMGLIEPASSTLFYAILSFLLLAQVFGETKVVDKIIRVILASIGRVRGGGGYVSLFASTFMAALSGTGPGNVASTGVFTIPTMIRTGFPRALAATTEMSSSALGNIIPPSGIVLLTFGVYDNLYGGQLTLTQFWLLAWGVGILFFLQRWITLIGFCWYYKVEALPPEERPPLKESLRSGWMSLIIPLIIFLPLLLDNYFGGWIAQRLGSDGQAAFSRLVLVTTPGVAMIYSVMISPGKGGFLKKMNDVIFSLKRVAKKVAPVAFTIYVAYGISLVFNAIGMEESIQTWFVGMGLTRLSLAVILPLFTMFLGMVLPGSSQVAILGGALISTYAALGLNPLLIAAMLPALTGAMEGMTPPLALSMYVAMGIAESPFGETVKLAFVWISFHLLMTMVILAGWLPVPFL
jgi:C4-dicarboxylate transporter, DctM subunit